MLRTHHQRSYTRGSVESLPRRRRLQPTDTSLTGRAAGLAETPDKLNRAHAAYRSRKRTIEADRDFTVTERKRALAEAADAYEKEVRSIAKRGYRVWATSRSFSTSSL